MDLTTLLVVFIVSYLLGALSFGRIVAKIAQPDVDLNDVEMRWANADEPYRLQSIGGNTASMKLGPRLGCTIGILDILKVFIPTLVFRLLYPEQYYFLVAAVAGFIGHCWPIYYRFKGGRGISAFYGGMFAIDPLGAFVVAITAMVIGMAVLKELLLVYMGGVLLAIPWLWFTTQNPYYVAYAIAINVLFILAMIPEIKQIIQFRRKYGKGDMQVGMEQFPMGQEMLKLMNRFKLKKR